MTALRTFVRSILWVEVIAVVGLILAGVILTWAEQGYRYGDTFFTYRIRHLEYLPAWFAAALTLMVVNGFWMFRLASVEGGFRTPTGTFWGDWGASIPINPLRLFAINLVAIPVVLVLFLIVRANYW